jgi:hypothetical protein
MTFDEYLTEYYGFNTGDKLWRRMGYKAKSLLKESFKQDMVKIAKTDMEMEMDIAKAEDKTKLAKLYSQLYPSNK